MVKRAFILLIAAAVTALDQLFKGYVAANLAVGEQLAFVPHVLALTHVENFGVSFSIFSGNAAAMTTVNIVSAAAIVALIIYILRGRVTAWLGTALAFIAGGALGNLIDRLRLGKVVDMFMTLFVNFAIFNIADVFLTIGVVMLAIYLLKSEKRK
ncbi:MAG: signal peptidase II [Oscillospiraceae bacterium]|jgi:signal peptidase II|nr:signal peptidase II [Oscillospiraceae bacterium]